MKYSPIVEEYYREQRLEHEAAVDRNCRLLELARHNGFEIVIHDNTQLGAGERLWIVPLEFQPIAGCMAAVVR